MKETVCGGIPTGCGSHMPSHHRTFIDTHTHTGGRRCVYTAHMRPRLHVCTKTPGGFCRLPPPPSTCSRPSAKSASARSQPHAQTHTNTRFLPRLGQTLAAFLHSCATDVKRRCWQTRLGGGEKRGRTQELVLIIWRGGGVFLGD